MGKRKVKHVLVEPEEHENLLHLRASLHLLSANAVIKFLITNYLEIENQRSGENATQSRI